VRFRRLKLSGFKSFVEPVDLRIEPGLTGIVGPNGCGKSNLLEAIRWVMGEGSPKSLRGGGMEDAVGAGEFDIQRDAAADAETVGGGKRDPERGAGALKGDGARALGRDFFPVNTLAREEREPAADFLLVLGVNVLRIADVDGHGHRGVGQGKGG